MWNDNHFSFFSFFFLTPIREFKTIKARTCNWFVVLLEAENNNTNGVAATCLSVEMHAKVSLHEPNHEHTQQRTVCEDALALIPFKTQTKTKQKQQQQKNTSVQTTYKYIPHKKIKCTNNLLWS